MKTLDQVEKLKQLAAEAARDAAMPASEDYRTHRLGKEMHAKLKAAFPATDFYIATAHDLDTMWNEFPPSIELRWNDEPSISALFEVLHDFIEERRKDFHFETVTAHGTSATSVAGGTAPRSMTGLVNARVQAAVTVSGERIPGRNTHDPSPQPSPRVAALLKKTRASRGRLIFALDATQSRQPSWDLAAQLQSQMFEEVAKIGGLEVQLLYFHGNGECRASHWTSDANELARTMTGVVCRAGTTQIEKVLKHIRAENARDKVSAAIFVGDAVEEPPEKLYAAVSNLGVPVFCFQEADGLTLYVDQRGEFVHKHPPQTVETVLREIARLTNGAWARFDAGAAAKLAELLQAVARFAVGGVDALANLRSESALKLLGQIRTK